jgi:hypothetical protein
VAQSGFGSKGVGVASISNWISESTHTTNNKCMKGTRLLDWG